MSITSTKVTVDKVRKGTSPSKALPVISNDFNPVIDDLTSLDARVTIIESDVSFSIPSPINSTAVATASQVATGYITSTSASPTSITFPTGTLLGAALGAVAGSAFDLIIDNTAGASTVTMVVSTNAILSAAAVANAASFGLLTIPSGVTGIGTFTLTFSSPTAYVITRVA